MIIGVDEAGRGPALGPLVVAGLATPDQESLSLIGVRDSKQLSAVKREELFLLLTGRYPYFILEVPAGSIDAARAFMTMNRLEVLCFSSIIASMVSGRNISHPELKVKVRSSHGGIPVSIGDLILDAADVNEVRFGVDILRELTSMIGARDVEVVSRHKADRDHPVVGAASILAKVTRDRRIEEIRRSIGEDIGSGYPSDPRTREFLERWVGRKGTLPDFARSSWDTCSRLMKKSGQRTLMEY